MVRTQPCKAAVEWISNNFKRKPEQERLGKTDEEQYGQSPEQWTLMGQLQRHC